MNSKFSNSSKKFAPPSNDERPVAPLISESIAEIDLASVRTAVEIWQEIQDAHAEASGLSILLVDGHQPPSLAVSNNNSVCRVLQSSAQHAYLCEPYCGKAFDNVQKQETTISYRCHVNLHCVAVPLAPNPIRPLVAIVGRALTKVSDYENLLVRKQSEDWQKLPADDILKNLRFAESENEIFEFARRLQNLTQTEAAQLIEFVAGTEPNPFSFFGGRVGQNAKSAEFKESELKGVQKNAEIISQPSINNGNQLAAIKGNSALETLSVNGTVEPQIEIVPPEKRGSVDDSETFEDFAAWQLFIEALLEKSFKDACAETLRFLTARFGVTSLAWLERSQHSFKLFLASENLRYALIDFTLRADNPDLQKAIAAETSLQLLSPLKIEVFPLVVGSDVRAAVIINDEIKDDHRRFRLAKFSRQIAVSLEVLRLREELERRAEIIRAVQVFSGKLNAAEENAAGDATINLFDALLKTCAELLDASRGSLLLYDESEQKLKVQAAFGVRADELKQISTVIGDRIAVQIWNEGKPMVVENILNLSLQPAPAERGYRTDSFVSFPLFVGQRAIGVLNLTDKNTAENSDVIGYTISDLDLLEAIAPQLAIALDRANLHQKAGKFEQLSMTDPLTGLLNRRYLDERVNEEVNRSRRDGTPMSILMIDIDNFKKYNDRFGHQAGDEVLKITAQCLKLVLRSADVAARFGGEEFCLLLPDTSLSEAKLIAERVRKRIENADFPNQTVTVSVGVSAYSPLHNSPQEIIEAADKALYQAKRIGKNNVQLLLFGQPREES